MVLTSFVNAQIVYNCSSLKSYQAVHEKSKIINTDLLNYDINYIKLDAEIGVQNNSIKGNVLISAKSKIASLGKIVFELQQGAVIDSVFVNGKKENAITNKNLREINLSNSIQNFKYFNFQVFYYCSSTNIISDRSTCGMLTQIGICTASNSEPFFTSYWLPCKQVLENKIDSMDIAITVDDSLKACANGILKKIDTLPNHKLKFNWKTNYPTAYYLIAIAAGKYIDYSFSTQLPNGKKMMIQNYIYEYSPTILSNSKSYLDTVAMLLNYYSTLFGEYPFANEKYGHCMAPINGGMENQTMTTIYSLTNMQMMAHELGHSWFGDKVTCGSWGDIWLNEGFASYTEYLFCKQFRGESSALQLMNKFQKVAKIFGFTPVYIKNAINPSRIFSPEITYQKGAAIIHALRYEINNDELFFNAIRKFQTDFAYKTASVSNLIQSINEVTKKDYQYFFDEWYYGVEYPVLSMRWNQQKEKVMLIVSQTNKQDTIIPFFKMDIDCEFNGFQKDTTLRLSLKSKTDTFYFCFSDKINESKKIEFDPLHWLIADVDTIYNDLNLRPDYASTFRFCNQNRNDWILFPNPSIGNFITLSHHYESSTLEVFDILGRKVIYYKNCPSNIPIQVNLSRGLYSAKLTDNSSNYGSIKKWIVQ
jgi:aminopeptidase N